MITRFCCIIKSLLFTTITSFQTLVCVLFQWKCPEHSLLVQMAHTNEGEFPLVINSECTIAEQLELLKWFLLLMLRNWILSANIWPISFHMFLLNEKPWSYVSFVWYPHTGVRCTIAQRVCLIGIGAKICRTLVL